MKEPVPRLRALFGGVDWWTVPEKRAYAVKQIRDHEIKEEHNYWGSERWTPMRVRKELIAAAYSATRGPGSGSPGRNASRPE